MDPDISSFPLLRIDQLPIHTTETLEEAQRQLIQLEKSEDEITSITPFLSKLLHCISRHTTWDILLSRLVPSLTAKFPPKNVSMPTP